MSTKMYTVLGSALLLVAAILVATSWAADKAPASKNCCEAGLACCKDGGSACCTAEKRLGCCEKGMTCCEKQLACCSSPQSCCAEGKACCEEGKACCGAKEEAHTSASVTPSCCSAPASAG